MRTILPNGNGAGDDGFVVTTVDTIQLTQDGNVSLVLECRHPEDGRPFLRRLVISVEVLIRWLAEVFVALMPLDATRQFAELLQQILMEHYDECFAARPGVRQ